MDSFRLIWRVLRSWKRRDGSPDHPKDNGGKTRPPAGARTAGLRLFQKGLRQYAGATGGQAGQSEEMTVLDAKLQLLSGHAEEKSLSGFGLGRRFKGL